MSAAQWANLTAKQIKDRLAALRTARIQQARIDPNVFIEHVLRDEKTNKQVIQEGFHREWQRLITAHTRLVMHAHIESAKTQQISIGRVLWEIGNNPDIRITIISNTDEQARKIIRSIKEYIEESPEYHEVFPHIKPSKKKPWNEHSLTVMRRSTAKDPTVQAKSVKSKAILGSRQDWMILDDYQNYDSTRNATSRQEMFERYNAVISGRLVEGGRVTIVETPWHPDDPTHRFLKNPIWKHAKYPVIYDETINSNDPPEKRGTPRWAARWSAKRIQEKRDELELQSPIEFQRQLLVIARDESAARFKAEWIRRALELGEGRALTNALKRVPPGFRIYTGVDLAVQQHAKADLSVFFTIAVHPDGRREVLCIESGRWFGPDIVNRLIHHQHRFQSLVVLENVGAMDFIRHFVNDKKALPITTFTTGKGKASLEFWAEKMAAEMQQGHWVVPNNGGHAHPEVVAWLNEVRYFDPANHTGDRMAAGLFAMFGASAGIKEVKIRSGRLNTSRR